MSRTGQCYEEPKIIYYRDVPLEQKKMPSFINHEAWIEYSKPAKAGNVRAYLKRGHFLGIDENWIL